MSKFLNTLIIGVASGAAAAYFFTTEKGKAVKSRIDEEIASFKEDPKAYQNQVVEKASDYKDLAVDTFQDYKTNLKWRHMQMIDKSSSRKNSSSC